MNDLKDIFLSLLRMGIWGKKEELRQLSAEEWILIYQMAMKQKVYGFIFDAILLLKPAEMPGQLIQQWAAEVQTLEQRNKMQMMQLVQLQFFFENQHQIPFRLLKGQGIARNYPNGLHRYCGDLDLWFRSAEEVEKANLAMEAAGYKVNRGGGDDSEYEWNGTAIEHHYELVELHSPFLRKKLREWEYQEFMACKEIPNPIANLLLQITHILKHQLNGGIGFRQICDLAVSFSTLDYDCLELERLCRKLGIYRWSKLLCSLLHKALKVPQEKLPFPCTENPDAMLNEIWEAGDFGHGDTRFGIHPDGKWASKLFTAKVIWHKTRVFFFYVPAESFWWQAGLTTYRIKEILQIPFKR